MSLWIVNVDMDFDMVVQADDKEEAERVARAHMKEEIDNRILDDDVFIGSPRYVAGVEDLPDESASALPWRGEAFREHLTGEELTCEQIVERQEAEEDARGGREMSECTARDAVHEALTRHVWENDPEFEQCVDEFIADLKAAGYEIVPAEGG